MIARKILNTIEIIKNIQKVEPDIYFLLPSTTENYDGEKEVHINMASEHVTNEEIETHLLNLEQLLSFRTPPPDRLRHEEEWVRVAEMYKGPKFKISSRKA